MEVKHLNQEQVARRWNLSPRSLERWRWRRIGPKYLRLGGRVCYRLTDIEDYERQQLRGSGSAKSLLPNQDSEGKP